MVVHNLRPVLDYIVQVIVQFRVVLLEIFCVCQESQLPVNTVFCLPVHVTYFRALRKHWTINICGKT